MDEKRIEERREEEMRQEMSWRGKRNILSILLVIMLWMSPVILGNETSTVGENLTAAQILMSWKIFNL